jgi:hypothetical protein
MDRLTASAFRKAQKYLINGASGSQDMLSLETMLRIKKILAENKWLQID